MYRCSGAGPKKSAIVMCQTYRSPSTHDNLANWIYWLATGPALAICKALVDDIADGLLGVKTACTTMQLDGGHPSESQDGSMLSCASGACTAFFSTRTNALWVVQLSEDD